MASELDRVGEVFVARCLLEDGVRTRPIFGVREIVHYLNDPSAQLSNEQTRLLFADAKLRDAFRRIKSRAAAYILPTAAAACDADIVDRRFQGGSLRLRASRRPGQSYLVVTYDNVAAGAQSPSLLVLEGESLVAKIALPAADDQGKLMVILDDARDVIVLSLLKDPTAFGTFI